MALIVLVGEYHSTDILTLLTPLRNFKFLCHVWLLRWCTTHKGALNWSKWAEKRGWSHKQTTNLICLHHWLCHDVPRADSTLEMSRGEERRPSTAGVPPTEIYNLTPSQPWKCKYLGCSVSYQHSCRFQPEQWDGEIYIKLSQRNLCVFFSVCGVTLHAHTHARTYTHSSTYDWIIWKWGRNMRGLIKVLVDFFLLGSRPHHTHCTYLLLMIKKDALYLCLLYLCACVCMSIPLYLHIYMCADVIFLTRLSLRQTKLSWAKLVNQSL